jgi:hypothetical protein
MKSKREKDMQQTAQRVYSIACECGISFFGETGRPLAVRLHKHDTVSKRALKNNQNQATCLLEGSEGKLG